MKRWGNLFLIMVTMKLNGQESLQAPALGQDLEVSVSLPTADETLPTFDLSIAPEVSDEELISSEITPDSVDMSETVASSDDLELSEEAPLLDDLAPVENLPAEDLSSAESENEPVEQAVTISSPVLDVAPVAVSLPEGWQEAQKPGNYQKKAQIFNQAVEIYDQIRAVEPQVLQQRDMYFAQKANLNSAISDFFYSVGATQAEISQQIDTLLAEFDAEEKEDNELLEAERELVLELNQNKSDLNVLKQNIDSLGQVTASLDSGLVQLDSLLSKIQGYEDTGWQLYLKIDEIFDDIQAEDLLAQMTVIQDNAESILTYIKTTFSQFFSSSISMINTQISQINSTLTTLQDRGVAIAQQEEQFEADEQAREDAEAQAKAEEAAAKTSPETMSWQSKIQNYLASAWQWVAGKAAYVYGKLFNNSTDTAVSSSVVDEVTTSEEAVASSAPVAQNDQSNGVSSGVSQPSVTIPAPLQAQSLPQPPAENGANLS